jgi:hypothetical protein
MYQIDFNTCTAIDVIQRSITCHPSLLADGLRDARKTHANYAAFTTSRQAADIAKRMAADCDVCIEAVEDERLDIIASDTAYKVIAFGVAARLNLVPRFMFADIMGRG